MFSDLSYSTLSFDIPDPLNFDDLLDIAHEFQFTRTITHIWPCDDDEATPFADTGLEDILSAIALPTLKTEESPRPLPSSPPPMTFDAMRSPASVPSPPDTNVPNMFIESELLRKDDGQVQPITPKLVRGWSPPNGSQYLDLDDSQLLPQASKDIWTQPWLTPCLSPFNAQRAASINRPSPTESAIHDAQPKAAPTKPKLSQTSAPDEVKDSLKKEDVLTSSLVAQPLTRFAREPARARQTLQPNLTQTLRASQAKASKSRSTASWTPRYTKPPRGGVPPHIARSVTKANILRVENERKMIHETYSTTAKEAKIPSVLRRVTGTNGETSKMTTSGAGGKKPFIQAENSKEGRVTKRARV